MGGGHHRGCHPHRGWPPPTGDGHPHGGVGGHAHCGRGPQLTTGWNFEENGGAGRPGRPAGPQMFAEPITAASRHQVPENTSSEPEQYLNSTSDAPESASKEPDMYIELT